MPALSAGTTAVVSALKTHLLCLLSPINTSAGVFSCQQVAKRAALRAERKLAASINASASTAVKQQPAAPAAAPNGGGGGGTRVMIIGE